jgi:hypothetical protein
MADDSILFSDKLTINGHWLGIHKPIQRQFGTLALYKMVKEIWRDIPPNKFSLDDTGMVEYDSYFVVVEDVELAIIRSTWQRRPAVVIQPGRPVPKDKQTGPPVLAVLANEFLPISKKKPTTYFSIVSPCDIRRKYGVDEMQEWAGRLLDTEWNVHEVSIAGYTKPVRALVFRKDVCALLIKHRMEGWIGLGFMWNQGPFTFDLKEFSLITAGENNEGYKLIFAQQRTK